MARHWLLVTGGAGFIGSNFIQSWLGTADTGVVNLDKLTYAGNLANLAGVEGDLGYVFVQGDIADRETVDAILKERQPVAVVHFAAESHVDRSIHIPDGFFHTNVYGTFGLLEASRAYWSALSGAARDAFRFLHVSTDEVYGSLQPNDRPFTEDSPHRPNSPYAASKASADHLVRAYHHTYGLPVLTVNCSNNYGPHQFPEKLIPLMILTAVEGKPLPVYGDGQNVRDWLYVKDHCAAIGLVLQRGRAGETYNIGGDSERTNLDVVTSICRILDELRPPQDRRPLASLVRFVEDRPGHDRRYAIDARKIRSELGWAPRETFESGLRKTVEWYLSHPEWVARVMDGSYRRWLETNYGNRASA
jgi:dTDP-glucose 4,6-dehydratase